MPCKNASGPIQICLLTLGNKETIGKISFTIQTTNSIRAHGLS